MPAPLIEVFTSFQGEGPYVGYPQLFIRFAGCNLRCRYCDTPVAADENARIEATPGRGDFRPVPNPVTIRQLLPVLTQATGTDLHSWSLTGGEPLLYPAFIRELVSTVQPATVRIYLETNGTLSEALTEVIDFIDIIAMDIKVPSTSGLPPLWTRHRQFLQVASQKEVFVKVVVTDTTEEEEIEVAASLIASVAAGTPLILQPVSTPAGLKAIDTVHLLRLYRRARAYLGDVRVIPQVHRIQGWR